MDVFKTLMSGFSLDLGPLKEPLGFIRVLEWVFSIFAFSTTGGYSGETIFNATCVGASNPIQIVAHFAYPFRLPSKSYDIPLCNGTNSTKFLSGDFSSSAEFYVCVGVFGFLYCTFTLVLYLGYQHVYRETSRGPVVDLVVTGLFTFLWLVSSSAWAKGLTDVKNATYTEYLAGQCSYCQPWISPSMGRLNASVIFGFLNLILWAGNCWFIYKETPFHKPANPPANMEGGAPSS